MRTIRRAFDAWDVDRTYFELLRPGSRGVGRGRGATPLPGRCPLDATLRAARHHPDDAPGGRSRRLEFHTEVEWHERHRFLKVAFPVAVRSARGYLRDPARPLERPTVANTSWDEARFEVCGHRWADLSEPGYGVALLNSPSTATTSSDTRMRLSLLRAPGYPDPEADQGSHQFAYALLPHDGDLREAGVIAEAESLQSPSLSPGRWSG